MNLEAHGTYLGRPIRIVKYTGAGLSANAIDRSVVLLLLGSSTMPSIEPVLKTLVGAEPMAIVLHGAKALDAFDALVAILGSSKPTRHVMTKHVSGTVGDAVLDLLEGTWPSEERHDSWASYTIVTFDEAGAKGAAIAARAKCDA